MPAARFFYKYDTIYYIFVTNFPKELYNFLLCYRRYKRQTGEFYEKIAQTRARGGRSPCRQIGLQIKFTRRGAACSSAPPIEGDARVRCARIPAARTAGGFPLPTL